jgi:hypothetical protein
MKKSRDALIEALVVCVKHASTEHRGNFHEALGVYRKQNRPDVLKRNQFARDLVKSLYGELEAAPRSA